MSYATTNPYTGKVEAEFPTATDDEVKAAIGAADAAFRTWREKPISERVQVLHNAATILRDRHTEYAKILTLEMGKLIGEAEAEVELSAKILEYYVKNAEAELAPRNLPAEGFADGAVQLVYEPLGVLYIVEPWNFPYYQIVRIGAPQLAAGNTVILKHASIVPQAAAAFEALFRQAGLPDGAFINLYTGHDQTELILSDPRVKGVALTGSEDAGAAVAQAAGKYLKKSTLELGGADAFIVLDDADLDKAVDWAVFGRHWNGGQVCVSSKRMIVVDSVYDEFLEKYKAGVAALKAGDPLDPGTTLAPLSSKDAQLSLGRQVEQAIANGAHAETVGEPVPAQGNFYQPTIITDITPGNPAYYAEFFGPVSHVYRVADETAAIKLANDSPFGLGGSVFTRDIERGKRVAAQLETGMVYLNHPTGVKADIPFGGVKHSGYGHELIDLGIHEFVNIKPIVNTPIGDGF
ncbi:MAG TPA: NAD-dependent succinate-semialdehyde dehydrogenase [Streptosporangiaceae bacterium]|nr:NAD-dependent succinate-semialdehyde dehydrogenase [Streptosporangiaceae bacterium]